MLQEVSVCVSANYVARIVNSVRVDKCCSRDGDICEGPLGVSEPNLNTACVSAPARSHPLVVDGIKGDGGRAGGGYAIRPVDGGQLGNDGGNAREDHAVLDAAAVDVIPRDYTAIV